MKEILIEFVLSCKDSITQYVHIQIEKVMSNYFSTVVHHYHSLPTWTTTDYKDQPGYLIFIAITNITDDNIKDININRIKFLWDDYTRSSVIDKI